MKSNHLTEEAAYKLLRKKSMDTCRSMKEIADAIIIASEFSV